MTKRIGGFVEKLFYTIIAYTHGNISPKIFLCQCEHIPWNLIVSIGREYTADPVQLHVLHIDFRWRFSWDVFLAIFKVNLLAPKFIAFEIFPNQVFVQI